MNTLLLLMKYFPFAQCINVPFTRNSQQPLFPKTRYGRNTSVQSVRSSIFSAFLHSFPIELSFFFSSGQSRDSTLPLSLRSNCGGGSGPHLIKRQRELYSIDAYKMESCNLFLCVLDRLGTFFHHGDARQINIVMALPMWCFISVHFL